MSDNAHIRTVRLAKMLVHDAPPCIISNELSLIVRDWLDDLSDSDGQWLIDAINESWLQEMAERRIPQN